jgi:hypothetical protein
LASSFFLIGLCPGLVEIRLEDESILKDHKFLVIDLYLGFRPSLHDLHFFSMGFHFF